MKTIVALIALGLISYLLFVKPSNKLRHLTGKRNSSKSICISKSDGSVVLCEQYSEFQETDPVMQHIKAGCEELGVRFNGQLTGEWQNGKDCPPGTVLGECVYDKENPKVMHRHYYHPLNPISRQAARAKAKDQCAKFRGGWNDYGQNGS